MLENVNVAVIRKKRRSNVIIVSDWVRDSDFIMLLQKDRQDFLLSKILSRIWLSFKENGKWISLKQQKRIPSIGAFI